MKKIYTIVVALFLSAIVFAQAPQKISYQAVIRDASNNLVTSHSVGMKISILQGSATGTAVYTETQTPTTNANGLVSIQFGGGTGFSSIDWSTGSYFIQTETDPIGGTNYTITGTSQMLSVPYALYSKTAENGFSGNYNDLSNKPIIPNSQLNSDWNSTSGIEQILNKPRFEVSKTGDTLYLGIENHIIIPGISNANHPLNTVKDIDGNSYKTVVIGNQLWMAENLKTTKFNDGTLILIEKDYNSWINLTTPSYCWYNNDSLSYKNTYGALYNWFVTIGNKNICPLGWHVPTENDWKILDATLGGWEVSGGKMKEKGAIYWTGNIDASNSSGFTGLPGGTRNDVISLENFINLNSFGYWWTSSAFDTQKAKYISLLNFSDDFYYGSSNKNVGNSIRCLKD